MCVRTQIIRRTHIAQDEDEDVDMGNDSLVAKNKKLVQLLCLSQQRNEKAKAKIAGLKKEKNQLVRQNVALVERNLKLEKGFHTVTLALQRLVNSDSEDDKDAAATGETFNPDEAETETET